MENCKHIILVYLETVKQEVYSHNRRYDDKFYAIMKCINCGKIIKKEL